MFKTQASYEVFSHANVPRGGSVNTTFYCSAVYIYVCKWCSFAYVKWSWFV